MSTVTRTVDWGSVKFALQRAAPVEMLYTEMLAGKTSVTIPASETAESCAGSEATKGHETAQIGFAETGRVCAEVGHTLLTRAANIR